ncbi:MAG: putative luciferase-like oxidoreductase [Candidatus Binatia bacterium]|nr:MAG: putative luciferase-like oxidoreductase [Candidatus Binatia bacterium]
MSQHQLKFGVVLPLQNFADARAVAEQADRSGFYAIAAEDHFFMTGLMGHDRFTPRLECFTLLSALASVTQRVVLTQLVAANSFRHPGLTAKIVSSLHHISGGRVELGIGAGWFREEYEAFGFPYLPPRERVAQLAEAVTVIKRLWHEQEASFEGQYYRLQRAPHSPKPQPQPRVMLGGGGKPLLELAAQEADVVNIIPPFGGALGRLAMEKTVTFDLNAFHERVRFLHSACGRIGRDPSEIELSSMVYVVMGNSPFEARSFAEAMAAALGVTDLQAVYRSPNTLVGTEAEIVEEIRRRRDALGITYFFCNFAAPEMFQRFCKHVLPKLL